MKLLFTLLFFVFSLAYGSKEGILALSAFRLESEGIGSSGKVIVEGNQDNTGKISFMKIYAFGQEYVVSEDKLSNLSELEPNGIRISYESGYSQIGGRTIYIQLQMGFTSHTRMQLLISVMEDGRIEVGKIQKANKE